MAEAEMPPDPWQARVLASGSPRILLLCGRQIGKSTVAAALAILTALTEAPALILLLSPTLRQSGELFRDKLVTLYDRLGHPVEVLRQTQLTLELANGSRIVSLPDNEAGIRGYSGVHLLVIDEAARVDDGLYRAVRPMLAVARGRLLALTTPFGKRGWFYEAWEGAEAKREPWQRFRIQASQCPRIPVEFLAEERRCIGDRWYRQEYETSFEDAIGAVFAHEDIMAALSDDVKPMFPEIEA